MALDSTSLMAFNLFSRCARSASSPHAKQSSPAATEPYFPKRDFAMSIAKASSIFFLRGEEKWLIGK
jgi:hypothetical protein